MSKYIDQIERQSESIQRALWIAFVVAVGAFAAVLVLVAVVNSGRGVERLRAEVRVLRTMLMTSQMMDERVRTLDAAGVDWSVSGNESNVWIVIVANNAPQWLSGEWGGSVIMAKKQVTKQLE